MKIISGFKLCLGAALIGVSYASVPTPVSNIQVTLKGKKYQIDDVTTVSELQERLEERSGIAPAKQGKILHNGKRLSSSGDNNGATSLSEAGVSAGDSLSCIPSKKTSASSTKKKSAAATPAAASAAPESSSADESIKDLNDMVTKMIAGGMGGGSGDGGMPDMAEQVKMMKDLTSSPLFSEFMNDPAKLEESRQAIINNPMMKSMMSSMPGMSELLENKEAWAQAMQAAVGLMQQMEPEDMMKMVEAQSAALGGGGMPGMGGGGGGGGGGLFDGAGAGASSALDELSEGED